MTRDDFKYNHRIIHEKRVKDFPKQVRIVMGASILIGLLLALAGFIASVRATEELIRRL